MGEEYTYDASDQAEFLDLAYTYHPPKEGQAARYESLRLHARALAEHILGEAPMCREQAVSLERLEEVVMWANAAIARNE